MSTSGPTATSPPTPQPQAEATRTQSTPQQQQIQQQQAVLTKDELLHELQCLITRPLMIGELFRRLSAPGRRALAQSKMPLEELLLHYPRHFAVYRGKSKAPRATLHVAPPHCVPYQAHVLSLPNSDATSRVPEAESVFASMQGNTTTPAQTSSSSTYTTKSNLSQSEGEQAQSSTSNSLQVAVDFMTPQERLQIVLKYIPNEFTPYTSLSIPSWVRGKCMQYPMLTPMKYFTRHPQYFDVQAQTVGGHTFNVRRSLALQERIRMHTAK